jgi:SAM-dependent methyltransferase
MSDTSQKSIWPDFYTWIQGRPLNELFTQAIVHVRSPLNSLLPRYAIDMGCGDGTETVELLQQGWHVVAFDSEPAAIELLQNKLSPELRANLDAHVASFEHITLPPADFIYAGMSLPFCHPASFQTMWGKITASLRRDGVFAAHFFGERDSWAGRPTMSFQTRNEIHQLLDGWIPEQIDEAEHDGQSFAGPKHWHIFRVIARRPL